MSRQGQREAWGPFPIPQPSCGHLCSSRKPSIIDLNGALPLSSTVQFHTLPSPGYTRLLLGHSMSAFIDLYHVYSHGQVASSGKGLTSDRAYASRVTKQNDSLGVHVLSILPSSSQTHSLNPLPGPSSPGSLYQEFL